jgi:hypothetical protein
MTKSRGIGRGGARANSGPKKKPAAPPTHVEGKGDSEPVIPSGLSAEERRKFLDELADETLANVMANDPSGAARVNAARAVQDRTRGKPLPAKPQDDQCDFDDHWGTLLDAPKPIARAN